ncbi:MAG: glucose-1-phosphate adenylyltransferase, partial [Acutalibacteraceae bacterium]
DTVGVLTQYQPLELNDYIGSGQTWDLDRLNGGVHVLPPYQAMGGAVWYKGTANAIYQNIQFIERYNPKYVLVLSGDHIYKMDYNKMLDFHKDKNADCTIAVLNVPLEEACRFGIMNTRGDSTIYEFEEKPKHPKSNKASMGIYIFTWEKLKKYLIDDENDPDSSNDFGKNVIPSMLACGEKLVAYDFDGYWKDVGTIESLWDANLDLLNPSVGLDLSDPSWRIYGKPTVMPPHFVGSHAKIENSLVTDGCRVFGKIDSSVLFSGVTVESGASVEFSVVMPGAKICKGAKVKYAIIAENAVIGEQAEIGNSPEELNDSDWGVAVIGEGVRVDNGKTVKAGEMISKDAGGETK